MGRRAPNPLWERVHGRRPSPIHDRYSVSSHSLNHATGSCERNQIGLAVLPRQVSSNYLPGRFTP